MRKQAYFPLGLILGFFVVQTAAYGAEKKPARYDRSASIDQSDMNARADASRDETIMKLKRLIPSISNGPQRAELMFRLSEMYWKKANFKRLQAMGTWEERLEEFHAEGGKGKEPTLEAIPTYSEFRTAESDALGLYKKILKAYPKYQRNDEVLYNLGSSMYHAGNKKAGVRNYRRLIKDFPKSSFVADAWLELGEHYWEANNLKEAITAYTNAAKSDKPQIHNFAIYKLAWCDFNLGEYKRSVERFQEVVSIANSSKTQAKVSSRDRIQLMEEALVDLTRSVRWTGRGR